MGKAIALSDNKGDRTWEKETITLRSRHYETALRYWLTGFKSMSSLEVSILNRWRGMPAAIYQSFQIAIEP